MYVNDCHMQTILKYVKTLLSKAFYLQRWQPVFLEFGNWITGALVLSENSPV